MSVQTNLATAKTNYNYFNERKFKEASENISDNAVITNVPLNIQFKGKEGFINFMNFWVGAFPDAKVEIMNQVASDDYVVTEFHGRGTNTGVLETPMGNVTTGKKIDIPFCEIFNIVNGKIVSSNLYFDVATMMHQLELMPENA